MRHDERIVRKFRVSVAVSPTYFVPLFFRDKPESFQWARTQVIPLKKLAELEQGKRQLDDAITIGYDIPADSVKAAVCQSKSIIDFILNIASFHYSVGLIAKSPVSVVDEDTGEGITYDFHQFRLSKDDFCTKTVDVYLPMTIKDSRKTCEVSSDRILTYEPSEIFKVDDFYRTISLFQSLYFKYIENPKLKKKIGFSLNILKEAHQIPSLIPRFALYWLAFEELTRPTPKSGLLSQDSLNSIKEILKRQQSPQLSPADIKRGFDQIRNIHLSSKTNLVVAELRKYFDDTEERLTDVYRNLNGIRQKIFHTDYAETNVCDLWASTALLKSVVRQILRVHFKYPKAKLPDPTCEGVLHMREAPKPTLQI